MLGVNVDDENPFGRFTEGVRAQLLRNADHTPAEMFAAEENVLAFMDAVLVEPEREPKEVDHMAALVNGTLRILRNAMRANDADVCNATGWCPQSCTDNWIMNSTLTATHTHIPVHRAMTASPSIGAQ